jgi:hypothetical protein
MDKNLGFLLNPARLAGGAAATGLGMHLLGTSNPIFGGALAATYGTARAIDKVTGMRSPASTFVQHFAEQNAALRNQLRRLPPATSSTWPSSERTLVSTSSRRACLWADRYRHWYASCSTAADWTVGSCASSAAIGWTDRTTGLSSRTSCAEAAMADAEGRRRVGRT